MTFHYLHQPKPPASARVVVGTFGDASWKIVAASAVDSADTQTTPAEVIHAHADTLAQARNEGATPPGPEWLIFLDADDFLDPGYVSAMLAAVEPGVDLYQPATRGVHPDGHLDAEAVLIPARRSIRQGNWLVIGTMVRRSMFLDAGGFGEEKAWEDWALWARCFALGAAWKPVADAVYLVGVSQGRNTAAANDGQLFRRILADNDSWAAGRGLAIR